MPFKSEAQRKWMFANKPEMAKKWQKETGKKKLPEKKASPLEILREFLTSKKEDRGE